MRTLTVFALILTLLTGCGGRKTKTDQHPVEKPAQIGQIHLFMDASASMKGYLTGNTAFKDIVSELTTKANQIRPVTVWTVAGQPQAYKGDVNDFVVGLATTPMATGKSSELHRIFGQVGEKAKGNNIALLISDCILSFPDAEVKRNPDINRSDASSVLKSAIYDEFAQLKRNGMSTTVYAFMSHFSGTYYDYQNHKQKLTDESRPFYVWVIGKQTLVGDFNRQLADMLTAKPAKVLDFGASQALHNFDLFYSLNKKGEWRAGKEGLTDLAFKRNQPTEFAIGVDLSALPAYAQTEEFLKKNLKVSATDATVMLATVQKKTAVNTDRIKGREEQMLNKDTHVLTLRVDKLFNSPAEMHVELPVRFDDWYADGNWSTMDDRQPDGRQNKTFALEHLMNGVKEAYQSNTNSFLDLHITLQK